MKTPESVLKKHLERVKYLHNSREQQQQIATADAHALGRAIAWVVSDYGAIPLELYQQYNSAAAKHQEYRHKAAEAFNVLEKLKADMLSLKEVPTVRPGYPGPSVEMETKSAITLPAQEEL